MDEAQNYQYRDEFKNRTKSFAIRVVKLFQSLPKSGEAQVIGRQLLRSATSVAANYRAACRARSKAEFHSKISIVLEETDESLFWIEILQETDIVKPALLDNLYKENEELLKIVATIRKGLRD